MGWHRLRAGGEVVHLVAEGLHGCHVTDHYVAEMWKTRVK